MSENILETIKFGDNIKAQIIADENAENPRTFCEHLGTMICFHSRYRLGDKTELKPTDFDGWNELKANLMREGAVVILPLYLMDHSGISIKTSSFGDPWDSGQVGFIYAKCEKIKEDFHVEIVTQAILEKAKQILEVEVEEYNQFLTGDVWGYRIIKTTKCNACLHEDEIVVDSCWGFYGEESVKEALKESLPQFIEIKEVKLWKA